MEDLKEKIELMVDKVKNDPTFAAKFEQDPVAAAEEIMGVDLPNDQINGILDTVKTKINFDNGGILGAIKGLFD